MDLSSLQAQIRDKIIDLTAEDQRASQQGGALLTPGMFRQRAAQEFDQSVQGFQDRMILGLLALRELYEKRKNAADFDEAQEVIPFLEPEFMAGKEDSLAKAVDEESDLQEILGIELADIVKAHDLATEFFAEERYEDAADAFFCLSMIAPSVPELLNALAQAEYHAGRKDQAVNCYTFAYLLDAADVRPLVQAAYCLLQMGAKQEALAYLEQAEKCILEQDGELAEEIKALKRNAKT